MDNSLTRKLVLILTLGVFLNLGNNHLVIAATLEEIKERGGQAAGGSKAGGSKAEGSKSECCGSGWFSPA